MIDPDRPLRFNNDLREVKLVGLMPDGNLVVTSTGSSESTDFWKTPLAFDRKTGRVLDEYGLTGSALLLENTPDKIQLFFPLRNGRPMASKAVYSLFLAKNTHQYTSQFLEIVLLDGIATKAHIHAR